MSIFKHNLKCLTLLLLVISVKPIKLQDYQKGIVPRIFKIVEKNNKIMLQKHESAEFNKGDFMNFLENNANLEYRVDNILNRQEEKNAGVKKIWIKRVVPHGRHTPNLEYDKRFGLSFKPLIRLHKTKRIKLDDANVIPKFEKVKKDLGALKAILNLYESKSGSPQEKTYTRETRHIIQHMKEIDHIIRELDLPELSDKLHEVLANHHVKIAADVEALHKEILDTVALETENLRTGPPNLDNTLVPIKEQKPGNRELEGHYYVAIDGANFPLNDNEEEVSSLPCALFPHHPLWNYWNYKHKLYEDECPKGQIKIGDVCGRMPIH